MDDGQIVLVDLTAFELLGNFPLGGIVFCNNHNAGGVFVEAMHDAGPKFAEAAR